LSTKKAKISPKILDKIWALEIKKRANNKCEYCGSTKYLNSHHIYDRTNYNTRRDLDNGVCLCSKHHFFSNEFSAHKTPMDFIEWIIERRGEDWKRKLRLKMKKKQAN